MEYYKSTSTQNLNLEDGFMEFITAKCINGERGEKDIVLLMLLKMIKV